MILHMICVLMLGSTPFFYAMNDASHAITSQPTCAICLESLFVEKEVDFPQVKKTNIVGRLTVSADEIHTPDEEDVHEKNRLSEEHALKQDDVIVLQCSVVHAFHMTCLRDYYKKNKQANCPFCRASIERLYRDEEALEPSCFNFIIKALAFLFCRPRLNARGFTV